MRCRRLERHERSDERKVKMCFDVALFKGKRLMRRPSVQQYWCFLLAVQLCVLYRCHGDTTTLPSSTVGGIAAAERGALVAFYHATNGESWDTSIIGRTQMWDVTNSTSNYCGWYGVSCCCYNATLKASYGVVTLSLSGAGLTGSLPSSLAALTLLQELHLPFNHIQGTLPPGLSQLTSLTVVNMTKNGLQGTLPPEYASWTRLLRFDVSMNRMNGTLPTQFANWTNHAYFAVDSNEFTGELPSEYAVWGAQLRVFSTRNNTFTSTLPPQYSSWVNMTIFQVDNTPLTGTLPASYGAWKAIVFVILCNTNITGSIPNSWGSWRTVTSLQLYMNKLTGTLPASFGNLSSLTSLSVAMNNFTGTLPGIEWSKLRGVQSIILQDNPFLSGVIPASWNNVFAGSGLAVTIVAVCRTNICAPRLQALMFGYACIPQFVIPLLSSEFTLSQLLMYSTFTASVGCVPPEPIEPSTTPTVITITTTTTTITTTTTARPLVTTSAAPAAYSTAVIPPTTTTGPVSGGSTISPTDVTASAAPAASNATSPTVLPSPSATGLSHTSTAAVTTTAIPPTNTECCNCHHSGSCYDARATS